jgi:hypothetical protein
MEAEWEVNSISPQRTNIYIVYKAPDLVDSCDYSNIFSNSRKGKECIE